MGVGPPSRTGGGSRAGGPARWGSRDGSRVRVSARTSSTSSSGRTGSSGGSRATGPLEVLDVLAVDGRSRRVRARRPSMPVVRASACRPEADARHLAGGPGWAVSYDREREALGCARRSRPRLQRRPVDPASLSSSEEPMNLALWIAAALLALAFLATGLLKITRSKEQLAAAGMGWTEDFSPSVIKAIGVAEVLGAIGLILPAVLDVAPVLCPSPPSVSSW